MVLSDEAHAAFPSPSYEAATSEDRLSSLQQVDWCEGRLSALAVSGSEGVGATPSSRHQTVNLLQNKGARSRAAAKELRVMVLPQRASSHQKELPGAVVCCDRP